MRAAPFTAGLLALLPGLALSDTYEVKMLNRGESGSMVYEPDLLALQPGDTLRFIATHPSHNAASIPEIWPDAAPQVKGRIKAPRPGWARKPRAANAIFASIS